jgi:putative transcriptional regulator
LCALAAVRAQELGAGKLLVATAKSVDPDLAKSVVLIVRCDESFATGLIVNHRSRVPVSDLFPALKSASTPVYGGGPVTIGVRGLLRSKAKPGEAVHVFADVSMITNKKLLEQQVSSGAPASSFRIYAGYVGWSTQQLKNEVAAGLWRVVAGDAEVVFAPHPEKVWDRLSKRTR